MMESELDMVIANENFKADRIAALETQIQVVARARQKAREAATKVSDARIKFGMEHSDIIMVAAVLAEATEAEEAKLRELTLEAYRADPTNKHPAPEVGIREVEKLEYDSKEALKWAFNHSLALKLDQPAFEKIVKASESSSGDLSFVKIEKVAILFPHFPK